MGAKWTQIFLVVWMGLFYLIYYEILFQSLCQLAAIATPDDIMTGSLKQIFIIPEALKIDRYV